MIATMQQIAREADVSVGTVSRILTHQEARLAPATRRRVLSVADRMGYRPNLLVRGIRKGRSGMIGIVTFGLHDYHASILSGIHDELIAHEMMPLLAWSPPGPRENQVAQLHRLIDRRVEGVIINTSREDAQREDFRELDQRGVPFVAVGHHLHHFDCDYVGTDNADGATQTADHLLSLGHRRLAVLMHHSHNKNMAERDRAFAQYARAQGATVEQWDLADGNARTWLQRSMADRASVERASRPSSSSAPPTAVFAAADYLARDIYAAAEELGVRIPDDLAVCGFADLPFAAWLKPGLTTVRQDFQAMGSEAVRLLLGRLGVEASPPQPSRRVLVPTKLIVRESTCKAATSGRAHAGP